MQFVQGFPQGVYVGQTRVQHEQTQPSKQLELSGFNLALHVNDDAARVQNHRMALLNDFKPYGVDKITWMSQTHSTLCHTINDQMPFQALVGDGLVTQRKQHALMMMTADCLPVVLVNADGSEIANLHAGWRGLAHGMIENTIAEMTSAPVYAWLGAAISQDCFEIGQEVKEAFCSKYPDVAFAFKAGEKAGKYYADLYAIARCILQQQGVNLILGGDQCSYRQADEYFSYRREAKTGRMATFVFMA